MFYYNDSQSRTSYNDDGQSHMHDNNSEQNDDSFSLLKQAYDPSASLSQSQMPQTFVGNDSFYIPHDFDASQDAFLNDIFFNGAGLEDQTASSWDTLQLPQNKSLFPSLPKNDINDGPSESKQPQQHQGTPIPDTFLSLDDQQAILLSDPSFVRQQQLLQEQQKRCEDGRSSSVHQQQQQQEFRSNLTTMLGSPDVTADNRNVTYFAPQTLSLDSLSADNRMDFGNTPTPSFAAAKKKQPPKPGKAQQQQQQQQTRSAAKTTSPILIDENKKSSEIDHQRRRNELQARFRVSYARKPGAPTNSGSISVMSSSFSGAPKVKQSSTEYFGTSLPNVSSGNTVAARDDDRDSADDKASNRYTNINNTLSFPSRTMPIQIQKVRRQNTPQPMDAEQHKRWLDEQLEKVDFDDITVSELKEMLRQRGKPATGKKAILVKRLQEEREHMKAAKSGRAHRHSQPPPSSHATNNLFEQSLSYQASSPLLSPYTAGGSLPPSSPLPIGSPSSLPNSSSMYIPGSPNSVSSFLNRSINNLHIGSPPASYHARRYSPYATPGSPRLGSSPKSPGHRHTYSSSLPNDGIPYSPGSGSPLSSSYSSRYRPTYHNSYNRPKSYAPFTSSALATPDHDDDRDPFDDLAEDMQEQAAASNNDANPGDYNVMEGAQDNVIIDEKTQQGE